jgi:hypothetical protein
MDVPAPIGPTAEPAWPTLSADDLRRLHFFAYLRRTGRIRPPAPFRAEIDALCTTLLREQPTRPATIGRRGSAHHSNLRPVWHHDGLPPVWQAWAEKQKQRGAQAP